MLKKDMYKISLFFRILILTSILACSKDNYNTGINSSNNEGNQVVVNAKQFNFPSDNYIMVAAHRAGGFTHSIPENSLSAIANALELGVDIIEIDVRITLDHKLVVIHDKTLNRTTNGSGKVSHHTLEQIKNLFLKDGSGALTNEKVPTLEEVMNAVGNTALVFIDKSEYLLEYVIPVLETTSSYQNALFMDFIEFDRANAKYKNLLQKSYYVPGVHDSNADLDAYYSGFKDGLKPNPAAFAFWFKNENNSKSFSLIENALDNDIPVWINTTTNNQCAGHTDEVSLLNPESGWGWVLNQGAKIIFTDEPEALIDYLNTEGLR